MGDDVHHRGIFRPDPVAEIELVYEFREEVVARSLLLHPVVVDRVLVRDHDK